MQPAAGYDQSGQTFRESSNLPQPSDAAASGFYVTNPNNRLTNNAASGGYSGALSVCAMCAQRVQCVLHCRTLVRDCPWPRVGGWVRGVGAVRGIATWEGIQLCSYASMAANVVHAEVPPNLPTSPTAAGFIYPVLPKPIGPSRWVNIVPASRPMLRFDGNSAHSSGYMWCAGRGDACLRVAAVRVVGWLG